MIRDLREAAGLTQKQVAAHMGWGSAQYVSNIERGRCPIPRKGMKRLSRALKVQPVVLLNRYMAHSERQIRKAMGLKFKQ